MSTSGALEFNGSLPTAVTLTVRKHPWKEIEGIHVGDLLGGQREPPAVGIPAITGDVWSEPAISPNGGIHRDDGHIGHSLEQLATFASLLHAEVLHASAAAFRKARVCRSGDHQ